MASPVLVEKETVRASFCAEWASKVQKALFGFPALLAVLLAAAIFLILPKSNVDPDLGWHLRNAQYQLYHHTFIRRDLYSFTTRGKPWMDHEWLAEIPFYLGWKWGGDRGIFLVTYAVMTAILLGVYGLARMQSGNAKAAFVVSFGAIVLASVSFGPRTLLFGWLFLVLELMVLYNFRNRRDWLWVLPPLFLVWVNTHGSWLIGMVLLIVFALSGCRKGSWGSIEAKAWTPPEARKLIATVALSVVALFVNPYGWRLVAYPFNLAFHQKLNIANVVEWRSLDFHSPRGKIALAILIFAICLHLARRTRWALYEIVFVLVGIYAGFTYSRFLFLTAILALPFLAREIATWVQPYRPESDRRWLNALIMLACVVGVCLKFPGNRQLAGAAAARFPDGARRYLESIHPNGRLLNDYLWGGYLIWNLPRVPVFIDSRVDVFEYNGVFKDYLDLIHLKDSLGVLDKYRIRYVLFERDQPLSYLLEHTPGWKIDYQDRVSILFERSRAGGK